MNVTKLKGRRIWSHVVKEKKATHDQEPISPGEAGSGASRPRF